MRTRIATRAAALTAALGVLGAVVAPPALAGRVPRAREEEWWFAAWGIADRMWPVTRGRGVTVAVLDTGVNAGLPELNGVVLPGTDTRHGGTGDGRTDIDNEGGGHGTAMAALIAGQGGGNSRIVGVAPEARILPVTIDAYPDPQARAVRFAVDRGAKVINISHNTVDTVDSGGCPGVLQEAIAYAATKDVVVVAGAGNDGNGLNKPGFPAGCAGVVAVGAIDNKLRAWPATQRQPYVAVAAPGAQVGSTGKDGRFLNNISGTSQASALTSAAVALLRAKDPSLPARDVVAKIVNGTVDAGPQGPDRQTGAGAVLPPKALAQQVGPSSPNPPYERLDAWVRTNRRTWTTSSTTPPVSSKKKTSSGFGVEGLMLSLAVVVGLGLAVIGFLRRRAASAMPAPPVPPAPRPPDPPPPAGQRPRFLPPDDR